MATTKKRAAVASPLPPMTTWERSMEARGAWERRWLGDDLYHRAWDLIDESPEFSALYFHCVRASDRRTWLQTLARVAEITDLRWRETVVIMLRVQVRAFLENPAAGAAFARTTSDSAQAVLA